MEAVEEVVVAPPCHEINNDISPVAKGKRTKRLRPQSPIPFTVNNHRLSPGFSTTSAEDSTTTEEEDTARCLILLSQGYFLNDHDSKQNDYSSKRKSETAANTTDKGGGGACMYACKTCNRVFSSFQALGGHRTSHKKPKNEKKSALFYDIDEEFSSSSKKRIPTHSLSLQLSSTFTPGKPFSSPRIHECSYCGAEFTSGQALGGHMRRHRAEPISPSPSRAAASIAKPEPIPKKPRNRLSLDLNFPAPEDENQKCEFGSGQQKNPEKLELSTTTSTLVDCHF